MGDDWTPQVLEGTHAGRPRRRMGFGGAGALRPLRERATERYVHHGKRGEGRAVTVCRGVDHTMYGFTIHRLTTPVSEDEREGIHSEVFWMS